MPLSCRGDSTSDEAVHPLVHDADLHGHPARQSASPKSDFRAYALAERGPCQPRLGAIARIWTPPHPVN